MLWLLSNKLLGGAFTQNILLILCDLIAAIQHFFFLFFKYSFAAGCSPCLSQNKQPSISIFLEREKKQKQQERIVYPSLNWGDSCFHYE